MQTHPILSPAYYSEHVAFQDPPKNAVLKEIIPRIVALVAPILYVCQAIFYATVAIVDLTLCLCCCSPGILFLYALHHTAISIQNCISSFFEIPEKFIFGQHRHPNYYGDSQRYVRKDLREHVDLM